MPNGIIICERDLQSENALLPSETTDDGMVIRSREMQSQKASFPIKVTFGGIVMLFIRVQQKAYLLIDVNSEHSENSIEFKFLH